MSQRPPQPSLLTLGAITGLTAWATWRTRYLWYTDLAFIPVLLGMFAVAGGLKLSTLSFFTFYNYLLRRSAYAPSLLKGSASWATSKEIKAAWLYEPSGVFLGCDLDGKPIFFDGETHGLTLAPAGSGKTVSFTIPALCHVPLPIVVFDFKGTVACMTKHLRITHHKQDVYCVNPAHLYEDRLGKPARYNPVQILLDSWTNPNGHKDLVADAQDMALQLYPDPASQGENQYWRQGSRKILVFLLVYLVTLKGRDYATLSHVLRLLRNVSQLKEACYIASCSDVLDGELADMATDLLSKLEANDTRQVDSFLEGAIQSLLAFAPSGWLTESTSTCDFRFKDLKDKPATVYLIADPTKMKVFAPWLGLMGWAAITELTRCQNTTPVFLLLDEATNFKIANISNALTGLREFGIRVWFVIQELEEYSKVYGREALETLLSQTEVKQIFGVTGAKTCELVSRMLGEHTVKSPSFNLGHYTTDPVQHSVGEHARRLLNPDEVRRFSDTILFIRNHSPIHAVKVGYHEVNPWMKWVDENPLFGSKLKGTIKVWLRCR
jgi:type IV secretion system protein VirD4